MNGFLNNIRFGIRQLASKPGFAAAAILTLALGIGANTAVFSFLSGYLLKPLPYPQGAELVQAGMTFSKLNVPTTQLSLPVYKVIQHNTSAFAATAFYHHAGFNLNTGRGTRHVSGIKASASLFHVLGVQPLLGRTFAASNMHVGSNHVAVISYGLWRNVFGADADVIGKTVRLDGAVWQIIGVMPAGFAFPDRSAALWVPYTTTPVQFAATRAFNLNIAFIGRLKSGVGLDTAKIQVQQTVSRYVHDEVAADVRKGVYRLGFAMDIQSWRKVLLGDRPATLWLLQGAVSLILLITCVNVANLLLSRILGRGREIAIRSTLGATRGVLARQLLGEALCLTVPGGAVGVALCWLSLRFLGGSSLGAGDSVFDAVLDWRVGLFAFAAVLVTAVLVSVLPIRHLAKADLQEILQEGSRTSGGGRHSRRMRNVLVVTELTLATGLLAMAGLLLHSFMNLEAVDPGFRKDHVLMASLLVPQKDYSGDALNSFYADLRQRVEALPGVRQVGLGDVLPMRGDSGFSSTFIISGQAPAGPAGRPNALFNRISEGYFKALGIPILRGRPFDTRDVGKPTAIIDAGLAKKYFHDGNPVGRQVQLDSRNDEKYTIIGVVPSIKYAKLSQASASVTMYLDDPQAARATHLVIHTTVPPSELIIPLKNLIAGIDPNVAVYDVHTMRDHLADSLHDKRTTMALLLAFGGIALALAIVGVYGVMSYAADQRRAEWGVRLALGALPEDLSWLVLKDGLRLLVIGLGAGLVLAILSGYLLSAQLFGVQPFDPVTLIGSAIVLCLITLAACYLPARRAAKLDPAVAIMER